MFISVSLAEQTLTLWTNDQQQNALHTWRINSAKNGIGEREGSECTPRGLHRISEKIGDGAALNTVFVGRVPTGEIYNESLRQAQPNRDWILTRILRLEGLESTVNRDTHPDGFCCDSWARYIYIHGTPDQTDFSTPGSKGCLRMYNSDLITLFNQVPVGTLIQMNMD